VTRLSAYSLVGYGRMIADEVRTQAYARALEVSLRSDSVVVDIGAGTGILSLLACRYGACKVYAVEPSNAIIVAEENARLNGFANRIEFIQAPSTEIDLPQKADLVVSDLHGVLPLYEQSLASLIDARRRLLAPEGKLIPRQESLWAAVVEVPEQYDDFIQPWQKSGFELNLNAASEMVRNLCKKARVAPDRLLTAPLRWAVLDYMKLESANAAAQLEFQVQRPGTAHGFVAWFDAELVDGIGFSNAPDRPPLIYGSAFFPFTSPVGVRTADRLRLRLRADLVSNDYVWSWETEVLSAGGQRIARFVQSTFEGAPISPAQLRKRGATYQPRLRQSGEIDSHILRLMDGSRSNQEISRLVMQRFPAEFPTFQRALTRIADVAEKYSN
jgi:type I protein arginine methyltransferase